MATSASQKNHVHSFRQPASGCAGAAPGLESSAARLRFKTASGNNYAPCEAALGVGHVPCQKRRGALRIKKATSSSRTPFAKNLPKSSIIKNGF